MNPIKILLLDLSIREDLGDRLRSIVESSRNLSVRVTKEPIDLWKDDHFEESYHRVTLSFHPDSILLVLPQEILRQRGDFIDLMSKKASRMPIMIFFECRHCPDTMTLVLGAGTVDFIRGPLTPVKVLPAVLSLVSNGSSRRRRRVA
jgi:hypothetical protein